MDKNRLKKIKILTQELLKEIENLERDEITPIPEKLKNVDKNIKSDLQDLIS